MITFLTECVIIACKGAIGGIVISIGISIILVIIGFISSFCFKSDDDQKYI